MTLLANESGVLAIFAVADTIKPHAREAISALHALGVKAVMLSGDNQATAKAVAMQANVDDARGNLLPDDKLKAIEALQKEFGPTAMTGDGINDAPALARADIGIAMGAAGTDTAMEAADIVIMNDDLRRIPEAIQLSRTTHRVLWQNIILALGIKASSWSWPCWAVPPCGWRCLPTWGPAYWWSATGCDYYALGNLTINSPRFTSELKHLPVYF
jgi:Cd2+/Zn2+-exporting ATPase